MSDIPLLKEPIVYCDVDDTLVSWEHGYFYREGTLEFIDPNDGSSVYLEIIHENVEALKKHQIRGHTVVVWSAGGAEWAKEVCIKLGIKPNAYAAKATWFYDDIPASQFMEEHKRKHNRLLKERREIDE